MGLIDTIKGQVDEFDKAVNPFRKVKDAIEPPQPPAPVAPPPKPEIEVRMTPTGAVEKRPFPE